MGRNFFKEIGLLKAMSNLALNISKDIVPTTFLVNLLHCFITPTVKKCFPYI